MCGQCGAELKEGDKECPKCGSTKKAFERQVFTSMGLVTSFRVGQKREGYKGFMKEMISRRKPSKDPELRDGVNEEMIIDKERDNWYHLTKDARTGEVTHEEHELLSQHKQKININILKVQFRGKPFKRLIEYHLKRQRNTNKLREAAFETMLMLPKPAHSISMDFVDRWAERAYEQSFWQRDTSEVFSEIVEDAYSLLTSAGIPIDDKTLFNMFQCVVLSYAYSASDQPKMRKFIGIK